MRSRYLSTYLPLAAQFAGRVRTVDYDKIPEPFLPVYGTLYETASTRIAFVGWETDGWGNISDFMAQAERDLEGAILRGFEDFDDLSFRDWVGRRFWEFIFRFLAAFHGIPDWRTLRDGENESILRSFAWGNTNAIERYERTAKGKEVSAENYAVVKEASRCFDRASHLLEVLQPDVLVLTYWYADEWWDDGLSSLDWEKDEYLWQCTSPETQTLILWTAHPRYLSGRPGGLNEWATRLASIAKRQRKPSARPRASAPSPL